MSRQVLPPRFTLRAGSWNLLPNPACSGCTQEEPLRPFTAFMALAALCLAGCRAPETHPDAPPSTSSFVFVEEGEESGDGEIRIPPGGDSRIKRLGLPT